MAKRKVVIMGAAGRDFHNFNCLFRDNEDYEVVAFTATQIPDIEGRIYPAELAGSLYPEGIPIAPEEELESRSSSEHDVDEVWFSYSDVRPRYVMNKASQVIGWGPHFGVCSATKTMLPSTKPVIAITAVRTGVGKSQTTRYVSRILKAMGKQVVAIRHPMPYGDLAKQACQRFATYEDLDRHQCTIEEREEYEPHIDNGFVVYAGVDYEKILREAEKEADVILWDGGNNDTPFYTPGPAHHAGRSAPAGHELTYYPGETNLRMADLLIVNKVDTADPDQGRGGPRQLPRGQPGRAGHQVPLGDHGRAARADPGQAGAGGRGRSDADPRRNDLRRRLVRRPAGRRGRDRRRRPYAVGLDRARPTQKYPNAGKILPAMGYGDEQIRDLEATINATPADVVVEGTPIELRRILSRSTSRSPTSPTSSRRSSPGVIEEMVRTAVKG